MGKGGLTRRSTGGSRFYQRLAGGEPLPPGMESWFVNSHCYTVLAVEGEGGKVKLRNPWAHHPEPDGIFALPVGVFLPAFYAIVTSGTAPKVD